MPLVPLPPSLPRLSFKAQDQKLPPFHTHLWAPRNGSQGGGKVRGSLEGRPIGDLRAGGGGRGRGRKEEGEKKREKGKLRGRGEGGTKPSGGT